MCPGNAKSITHEKLLMLKNATVNQNMFLNELCPPHVNIGLGRDQGQFRFEWDWDQWKWIMLEYPPIEVSDEYSRRSWDWEIQSSFFKSNNIIPQWIDNYQFILMIRNDTFDYCPVSGIVNTFALNYFADASSVISNDPYHWVSKKPDALPLTWNLLYLFPLRLWILTFVAILIVFLFMKLSSSIYKNFNERVITTELVLIPIRYQNVHINRNPLFQFSL